MARKLILSREDTVDRVLEAIESTRESAITVVAPRASLLADREGLARIGELAAEKGVAVAIESVDEELLALAHAAHLETVHPFFRADRRLLSLDGIVKAERVHQPHVPVHVESREQVQRESDTVIPIEMNQESDGSEEEYEQEYERPLPPHNHPVPTPVASRASSEIPEQGTTYQRPMNARPRRRMPWFKMAVASLVAVAVIVGVGEAFFRSGTVQVTLAETPWEFSGKVVAATSVTTSTGTALAIPGQLFESQKNVAQAFPATGQPGSNATPSGEMPKVTVFNESLEPETFVAKTRFEGESGIFRANTAVAIPAATKEGDKLVPGKASVEVTPESAKVLEQAAADEKLSVPGLAGSPKADLFYATLTKPAAPQAATTTTTTPPAERVVSKEDEEKAKTQITELLASSFRASLLASQPEGLSLIDGAIKVEPQQMTVNKEVDENGNFNLVGQATLRGLAFREEDLKNLLLAQAVQKAGIGYPVTFRNEEITYSEVEADLANGRIIFTVTGRGAIVGATDESAVKSAILGKSRSETAAWIQGQDMYSEGAVSISPFWRFSLPHKEEELTVEVR